MPRVHVTRIGFTKVSDHWNRSLGELAFDAASRALTNGISKPDALIVANAYSELTSSQAALGPQIADALDIESSESLRVESAGASGAAAIHVAFNMIKSGEVKTVLVVGVEKMRDLDPSKLVLAQGLSEHSEIAQFFGISFASMNALLARLYMQKYNIDRDKLSSFPVLSHRNSSSAAHAQFKRKFSAEEVSRSEVVSDPLRVLDCAPVGDGAACTLLSSGDELSQNELNSSIEIVSSESTSNRVNFFEREDPLFFKSTEAAARKALKKAQLTLDAINFFEIHDTYSVTTALIVEALGLSKRGHACIDASLGKFDLGGKHPISTFGGMKARGYPVGAASIYQLCESHIQLTGGAGPNQVKGAKHALNHSMSGIDGSSFVHVLAAEGRN